MLIFKQILDLINNIKKEYSLYPNCMLYTVSLCTIIKFIYFTTTMCDNFARKSLLFNIFKHFEFLAFDSVFDFGNANVKKIIFQTSICFVIRDICIYIYIYIDRQNLIQLCQSYDYYSRALQKRQY